MKVRGKSYWSGRLGDPGESTTASSNEQGWLKDHLERQVQVEGPAASLSGLVDLPRSGATSRSRRNKHQWT